MEIRFLPTDLARWDQVGGDLFTVCLWSDVRPLRGPAGLLDWRLNGKLSLWIRQGRLSGADDEKTLVPTTRVPWRTVLALGLGPSTSFSEDKYRVALTRVFETMRGLGLRTVAMALPGREADRITPERALELLVELAREEPTVSDFTVVDSQPAVRAMADSLASGGRVAAQARS